MTITRALFLWKPRGRSLRELGSTPQRKNEPCALRNSADSEILTKIPELARGWLSTKNSILAQVLMIPKYRLLADSS